MAEREGLPRQRQKINKIRYFLQARRHRVYQSGVPKSTDFAPPSARKFPPDSLGRSAAPALYHFEAVSLHLSADRPANLPPSPAYPEHPSAYPHPTTSGTLRREPFEWHHDAGTACLLIQLALLDIG
jgi:hypothetical protein